MGCCVARKGRKLYGVFWNVPCTLPPPEVFCCCYLLLFVFCVALVGLCIALYCVLRCFALTGRYGLVMVLGIVLCSVSWVIVSMFLFVVGGLFVLFRQAYYLGTGGTMVMQQVEEMTLAKAIEAIESLLEAFAFRSGGGDGDVIYGAIKALKYLKYLQNLQTVRQIQEVE